MPLLVLGTHNRKKSHELRVLLEPVGFDVRSLADYPQALTVAEEGETFAANAALKATLQARHLNCWVLGEDSGLAVDALGGEPGVYSARYSGPEATDQSNNEKLLAAIRSLPAQRRTAHYVCHATLSDPSGRVRAESEARCNGRLRLEPAGEGGFGYDPLFEILEYHRTFAQLGDAVKAVLSHRARAIRALIPQLLPLLDDGVWTPAGATAAAAG